VVEKVDKIVSAYREKRGLILNITLRHYQTCSGNPWWGECETFGGDGLNLALGSMDCKDEPCNDGSQRT